jgi:hypothetical protein
MNVSMQASSPCFRGAGMTHCWREGRTLARISFVGARSAVTLSKAPARERNVFDIQS